MNVCAIWRRARAVSPFGANLLLTGGASVALAAMGMASGILAARLLGPGGRGELVAIQTWPTFAASLAMLGMPEALLYFSARNPEAGGSYLASAASIGFIACLPFAIVGYLLMPQLLRVQSPQIVHAARWYLAIGPVYALTGMVPHPVRGRGDFASWNAMRLAAQSLMILAIAMAWMSAQITPVFIAATYLVAMGLLFLPFAAVAASRVPGPFLPELRQWMPMLGYGLPCVLTSLPRTLNLRLDQMLMTTLLAPRELGFYVVAVAWSGAVTPLLDAVASTTVHSVASASDHESSVHKLVTSVRIASALSVILAGTLTALSPVAIVLLFGPGFRDSIAPALVLVPAASVLGLNVVIQEGLRGVGRPYSVLWSELGGVVVTAVGLYLLLRPYGIMGAAVVSLAGYSTVMLILLYHVKFYTGVSPSQLLPGIEEIRLIRQRIGTFARNFSLSAGQEFG